MKEFFVTAKYSNMKIPDGVDDIAGGIIMPSGITRYELERRELTKKYPHMARRLLDPQLYLTELPPALCRKACTNLASYGWFPLKKPVTYNSKKQTLNEWKSTTQKGIQANWTGSYPTQDGEIDDAIRICLDFQKKIGVEAFILPAPLTSDINSDLETELKWLDKGIAMAHVIDPGLPFSASIALSDNALRGTDPWSNPLLDAILDQVSARGTFGIYLVLEQANEDGYYCKHPRTFGALLRLCHGFRAAGAAPIIVSYAGIAGLAALGAGAHAWTSGWYQSERRMKLAGFEDAGGLTLPTYYSHPLAGEFHLEKDLDTANKNGFLARLRDETAASEDLLKALATKKSSNSVAEWQFRKTNVAAAKEHFLLSATRETEVLAGMSEDGAEAAVHEWLKSADAFAADLNLIGGFHPRTSVNHQHGWLKAFEDFLKNKPV